MMAFGDKISNKELASQYNKRLQRKLLSLHLQSKRLWLIRLFERELTKRMSCRPVQDT